MKGKFRHAIFVGIPVRIMLMLYLIFSVTAVHNLLHLGREISTIVAVFTIMICLTFLAYVTSKYFKYLNADAKAKKTQFGWLARAMYLKRGQSRSLVWPILYLARRFLLSLIFVFCYELYAAQVVFWMILSLITLFTISRNKPFAGKWLNRITFINEIFLFVGGALMLPLANILEDLQQRDQIGIALIVWIMLCIAFNIIILLIRSFGLLYECCRDRSKLEEMVADKLKMMIKERQLLADLNLPDTERNLVENNGETDLLPEKLLQPPTKIEDNDDNLLIKEIHKVPQRTDDEDYEAEFESVAAKKRRPYPSSFVLPPPKRSEYSDQTRTGKHAVWVKRGVQDTKDEKDGTDVELQFTQSVMDYSR